MKAPILFRVEAGPKIGTGHLMRCLALAQAHAGRGGTAIFVVSGDAPALAARVRDEGFECIGLAADPGSLDDASKTLLLAERAKAGFVFADGYAFGITYHRKLRSAGLPLAVMDDATERRAHCADLVINQNLHARERDYAEREPHTRLLLGPKFALLRSEFLRFAKWKRKVPMQAKRLLVTLGGSDPDQFTERLVRALAETTIDTTIVVGGANPRREEIESLALGAGIHVRVRTDVRSMAALMARSDVAISSGGSTVWELAFMGLPSIVGAATRGEELVLGGLKAHELFAPAGRFAGARGEDVLAMAADLMVDTRKRNSMSTLGRALIDGLGNDRVLDAMSEVASEPTPSGVPQGLARRREPRVARG